MSNDQVLDQTKGFEVTDRYQLIKTRQIIDQLTSQGFTVTSTVQTKVRKIEKQGFQKHMVRLSHNDLVLKNVGDSRPELVLVNSHDKSTSLKLLIGVYRLVCANGLIVGDTFNSVSINHTGDIWSKIDKGLKDVKERLPMVAETIERMNSIVLTDSQTFEIANQAAQIIVPNATSVNLSSMLTTRRQADSGNVVWNVFNKVQETALRGGIKYQSETLDDNNEIKIVNNTSRAVKSIDRQVEINKGLWDLFSKVA